MTIPRFLSAGLMIIVSSFFNFSSDLSSLVGMLVVF